MRKIILLIALALALLLLTGCGAVRGNRQVDAGMTVAELEWRVDADGVSRISSAKIINGKEMQDVRLKARLADGTSIDYSATAVKAFDGQKARAALEQAISDNFATAAPDVVEKIIKTVLSAGVF